MSGITACVLLAAGLTSARAAVAGPVVNVPCKVSALIAAVGGASAGETLNLASGCVYHLTAALPTVSEDLTIEGNGSMVERSYDPGTPAFTILTITAGNVVINDLEIRHGDNGITLSGTATITVNDCVFVSNRGTDGGAISSTGLAGPVINGSIFVANKATDAGGAVYSNSALNGVTVTGSAFTDNIAANDGGAIFDFSGISEQVTGSLFKGNRASDGGGLWFSPNSGMLFDKDTISDNDATGNGGGIAAVSFGSISLQDSTITGNRALDGGGLYANNGSDETIEGSDFLDNTARDGGGIYNRLVLLTQSLTSSKVVGNLAKADGGGVYIDSSADPSGESLTATDSQITDNIAGGIGGGIFASVFATGTLTNSYVHANEPDNCTPPGAVTGCTG